MKDLLINLVSDALLNNHEINKTNVFAHFLLFGWTVEKSSCSSCILEPHKKSRCLFILEANLHLGFITSLSVANIKCIAVCKNPPPDIIVHHSQERFKDALHQSPAFLNLRKFSGICSIVERGPI